MRKAFSAAVVQHLPSSVFIFPRLELLTISLDRHSVEREVKGYIDASEMQCCQKSMKKHDVRLDAGRWIPASLDYSIIPNRELRRKTNKLMINVRNPIQSQSPSRQPGKRQCYTGAFRAHKIYDIIHTCTCIAYNMCVAKEIISRKCRRMFWCCGLLSPSPSSSFLHYVILLFLRTFIISYYILIIYLFIYSPL